MGQIEFTPIVWKCSSCGRYNHIRGGEKTGWYIKRCAQCKKKAHIKIEIESYEVTKTEYTRRIIDTGNKMI